jgi:hypothetical protein
MASPEQVKKVQENREAAFLEFEAAESKKVPRVEFTAEEKRLIKKLVGGEREPEKKGPKAEAIDFQLLSEKVDEEKNDEEEGVEGDPPTVKSLEDDGLEGGSETEPISTEATSGEEEKEEEPKAEVIDIGPRLSEKMETPKPVSLFDENGEYILAEEPDNKEALIARQKLIDLGCDMSRIDVLGWSMTPEECAGYLIVSKKPVPEAQEKIGNVPKTAISGFLFFN